MEGLRRGLDQVDDNSRRLAQLRLDDEGLLDQHRSLRVDDDAGAAVLYLTTVTEFADQALGLAARESGAKSKRTAGRSIITRYGSGRTSTVNPTGSVRSATKRVRVVSPPIRAAVATVVVAFAHAICPLHASTATQRANASTIQAATKQRAETEWLNMARRAVPLLASASTLGIEG